MVENVHRKLIFAALALLVSIAFLVIPERPFQLGLDLQGGTRLSYKFDLDKLPASSQAGQSQVDPGEVLNQIVAIIRNRVDPTGVREASIRREGESRIVVELPGTPDLTGVQATGTLAEAIDESWSGALQLETEGAADFPENGGTVQLGDEKVHYEKRSGTQLTGLQRGFRLSPRSAHAAGATVELASDDAVKDLIENLGDLAIRIVAQPADFSGTDTDLASEQQKLRTWLETHPEASVLDFNEHEGEGARHPSLVWAVAKAQSEAQALLPEVDRAVPLLVKEERLSFTGSDLENVYPTQDRQGFPAVGFELRSDRKSDFGRLTGDNVDRSMAITLNGVAESIATINERLPGQGIIQGHFSSKQVSDLITVIRSGSLPIKPELEYEEVVGPTLGHDYVKRGLYSGLLALAIVMAFMAAYYRRLGVIAGVALLCNLLMLLGGLAFLKATVTLPGIAGVILTVGMAVDANILIFDRIREEMDRGQNVKQAAKTGFEKAFTAIFDSNLTTLITAIILYQVGTGPVRGFAVTLAIGIIASMIAALVITRLLVHYSLFKGVRSFTMGQWMVTANYRFLNKAKLCITVSALMMIASVVGFAVRSPGEKLGIDFLGGGEVQINTEVAQPVDSVRGLVAQIPGAIGESAEVKPVLASAEGDGFTSFRITFKLTDTTAEGEGAEQSLKGEIERRLASILQKGPIEVGDATTEGGVETWPITLYFNEEHPPADAVARLEATEGLREAQLAPLDGRTTVLSGTVRSTGHEKTEVESLLSRAFLRQSDSNGTAFELSQPIPSSSLVGPQVVGELRDQAVLAMLVSLFAIVLYIRVRFAEYSYGVAAVAALVHDVIITLGALTLFDKLGLINGEITLPMIAAFLTIIGYSINDTIVIFDRVRENLPRMKKPLADVLEISINQTLSRTIMTSGTTLMAVVILFVFNFGTGNTLEGFSFAMIVGMIAGTYSTIWIANPILLWMEDRADKKGRGARAHIEAEKRARETSKGDDKAMVRG